MESQLTLLVVAAAICLIAAPVEVSAIRCYECNWSFPQSPFDCKDANTLEQFEKTCDEDMECYTYALTAYNSDSVIEVKRRCEPAINCNSLDTPTESCCTGDLCNGEDYKEPSVIDCYGCYIPVVFPSDTSVCVDPSAATNSDSVVVGCPKGYQCEMQRTYSRQDNYTEPNQIRRQCSRDCTPSDSNIRKIECCNQDLCNGRNMFVDPLDGASNMSYTLSTLVMMLILVSIM